MQRKFSVIVVDSRPMLEGEDQTQWTTITRSLIRSSGKKLLHRLSAAGIECTYLLLPATGAVIRQVSKVFVGAHSLHANGAVSSRAGTAMVAMIAKAHSIPVLVCCETYKYTPGIQLDSFSKNELGKALDCPCLPL